MTESTAGSRPWWRSDFWRRPEWWGALVVLLATQVVYLQTMTISVPFWDSGEFIATSYMLGIPHPPGTPLYVLIGRLFTMLPIFELAATKVNYLSALASSLAAVFMYWITVELYGLLSTRRGGSSIGGADASEPPAVDRAWIGIFAGLVTAFFVAFSRTFWDNAIEAEVYALASLIMALCVWMALRWARSSGAPQTRNGWFVLLYYLICLSMGIHLGTFLVLPGIVLFMLLWDRRSFGDSTPSALLVAGLVILLHPGMLPTLGLTIWVPIAGGVAVASLVWGRKLPGLGVRGILTWCLAAAVLGMSTHLYLKIRAGLDPAINEADPETWEALWKVLTRDQYKPPNPFVERQAPWAIQFTKHFWDYAKDQYSLGVRPAWLGWFLPYVMGLIGLVTHGRREKKTFALFMATYLIMSLGMVFYLNFKEDEVRERDYFFVASFQFFAVWIGLGAAVLLENVRLAFPGKSAESTTLAPAALATTDLRRTGRRPHWAVLLAGLGLAVMPFRTMEHFRFTKDRTENYLARNLAYNLLQPLAPNAILFTNGDNDTFPLWYLQFVENIRPDVTVANLSLLNTDWYIKQVRDQFNVDVGWTDEEISRLRPYLTDDDQVVYVRDLAVRQIVQRESGRRPLYIAVTVPETMGLENRMVMEGLAFSLRESIPGGERVDIEKTLHNLKNVYQYRGLLTADGKYDDSVYKDENSRRLSQNYAAAWLRAAEGLLAEGRDAEAMEAIDAANEVAPNSRNVQSSRAIVLMRAGRFAEAEPILRQIVQTSPNDLTAVRYLARALEAMRRNDEAEVEYRSLLALAPDNIEVVQDVASFLWEVQGKREEAVALVERWGRTQAANDPMAQELVRLYRDFADSVRQSEAAREARP